MMFNKLDYIGDMAHHNGLSHLVQYDNEASRLFGDRVKLDKPISVVESEDYYYNTNVRNFIDISVFAIYYISREVDMDFLSQLCDDYNTMSTMLSIGFESDSALYKTISDTREALCKYYSGYRYVTHNLQSNVKEAYDVYKQASQNSINALIKCVAYILKSEDVSTVPYQIQGFAIMPGTLVEDDFYKWLNMRWPVR